MLTLVVGCKYFHGKGIEYDENGVKQYEGDWKDHNFHGKGIEYDGNGDKRHEGDFVDGECVKRI